MKKKRKKQPNGDDRCFAFVFQPFPRHVGKIGLINDADFCAAPDGRCGRGLFSLPRKKEKRKKREYRRNRYFKFKVTLI